MNAFDLLSQPIRKYVYKKGWTELTKIQGSAIKYIMESEYNYILASKTASGKTEAAFFPILSKVNFSEPGVQILYVSPLIALINDQFYRIENLCKDLEIPVTKWHGEAKKSLKTKLIENPAGIVLITPESLEAMFVNSPYNMKRLFGNLQYIVIDEIHSFMGTDRGLQLTSILSRIRQENKKNIITIGLSATIGEHNYIEAKKVIGNIDNTKILVDKTHKETIAKFKFFQEKTSDLPLDLIEDLYYETNNHKTLIFPNSRARAEEIAVQLKKMSKRLQGHKHYFSHHSSIDKEIRESIELFAKTNERFNFCISCTSTLELGIDIGTVDKIVQVDATPSVSSLVQRIGRSGRKAGQASVITFYATNKWSLLQSLASWLLYQEEFLEPIHIALKPYDILLHQILSIAKQIDGCRQVDLLDKLQMNAAFIEIKRSDLDEIINSAIECNYLEVIGKEIILGIEGEKIVNSREFYSVFKTNIDFKVYHAGKKIGTLANSPQIKIDEHVLLSANIWKIIDIDYESKKIKVMPTAKGKKPIFDSGANETHPQIGQKMLEILKSQSQYSYLCEQGREQLKQLRWKFSEFEINNFAYDRPVIEKDSQTLLLYSFSGTKINRSMCFLLDMTDTPYMWDDRINTCQINIKIEDWDCLKSKINEVYLHIDKYIEDEIKKNTSIVNAYKWAKLLPTKYQVEILKERYYDFDEAILFINEIKLVSARESRNGR